MCYLHRRPRGHDRPRLAAATCDVADLEAQRPRLHSLGVAETTALALLRHAAYPPTQTALHLHCAPLATERLCALRSKVHGPRCLLSGAVARPTIRAWCQSISTIRAPGRAICQHLVAVASQG